MGNYFFGIRFVDWVGVQNVESLHWQHPSIQLYREFDWA
jgi:hypothetical protein